MQENVILILFGVTNLAAGFLLYLFFRRYKQHKRSTHRLARSIVGNTLVLLFLCSGLALAGEIRFRYFYDATDSFGLTKTTQRWFQRHFKLNQSLFRDSVEYTVTVPPGRRRVTFVGDSFTAAHGISNVEDRFVNQIRTRRPEWDVSMFANCGWDTGHQLGYLDYSAQCGYQFDVVVLVYCLNDLADIVPEWQETLKRIFQSSDPGFFVKHSYLCNALYFRLKASRDPDVADYYRFILDNYDGPVWDAQRSRLKEIRDRTEARRGRLVVVTFPFVHAVNGDYPYLEIHERLAELWKSLDVPHLDLLPTLAKHDSAKLVVNPYDAHPNKTAHRVAAETILTFLDEQMALNQPAAPD